MTKTNQTDIREILKDAHREMVTTLVDRLKSGAITHQELAILQKELSRNGIVLPPDEDLSEEDKARERAKADLPDDLLDEDEDDGA